MKCEIEFLPVGEGARAGDAIVVRYGEPEAFKLMLVDGGDQASGENIVSHLKKYFGDDVALEHVVLTHSDADHASGLREVLREIPVANIWMHIPWMLSAEAIHLFKDKSWTKEGLSAAIRKEYNIISELIDLAVDAKCQFFYPFQGVAIGPFTVLSPRKATYLHLLPQFDKTPDPDQELLEGARIWIGKATQGTLAALMEKVSKKIENWITESWSNERLKDGGVTSASNESSVVLYADTGEQRILLTGDAGIEALSWAASHAEQCGYPLQKFTFVQIPHHGSRRNVGPAILNRLLGPIQPEGAQTFSAFVSSPKDDATHPRLIVLNAFTRRGARVFKTEGRSKIHYGGFPKRDGYVSAEIVDLATKVEDYT